MLISTDEEGSENDAQCLYYRHFFSEAKGEKNGYAAQNVACEWCHEECAGESEDWIYFTCGDCLDG
jgi:hypothetical protein